MKYNINLEYKYKRKVWINMSRMLGDEHYAISRTINGLEKEGLVSRTLPRQTVLTEKGIEEAELTRFFMGVYALK